MRHFGTKPFETEMLVCCPFTPKDAEDMLRNWAADPCIQLGPSSQETRAGAHGFSREFSLVSRRKFAGGLSFLTQKAVKFTEKTRAKRC